MQSSQLPITKLPIPFGDATVAPYITTPIPKDSQIGITAGAASLATGFPPLTFTAPGAGGIPPFGADFNGILHEATAWIWWFNAGGPMLPYDATFAADLTPPGYPKGALVGGTAGTVGSFYISQIENNLTDPGAGPTADWQAFNFGNSGVTAGAYASANITVDASGRVTAAANGTLPTQTQILSGSGTYTTKAGCRQLRIRMIAGGGGGGAVATNNGATGGTTTFGAFTCIGGGGGINGTSAPTAGTGGTGGAGSANLRLAGADGFPGGILATLFADSVGGNGGSGCFGGGGRGGIGGNGAAGKANTGGGGGGGGSSTTDGHSAGGGAVGEYVELIINAPAASYAYAVGAGGAGGAAGTFAGGIGGSGVIIIDEIY